MRGLSCIDSHVLGISLVVFFVAGTNRWRENGVTVAGKHGQGNAMHLFNHLRGLYTDEEDTVVVADFENHRIVEWKQGATSGTMLAGGNGKGNRPNQLNQPTDVIIDKETDSLIICEWGNRRVTRWPRRHGTQSSETIIDDIACYGLAMDNEGYLYVTDIGKDEVRRYRKGDSNGILVAGGNGEGTGLNQLNTPRYVCVDGDHAVYVSDTKNHRVVKWRKDAKEGTVVAGWHGQGKNVTQLSHPQGVLVDAAGTVYVADFGNDRVVGWWLGSNQGSVVAGVNGRGHEANQLYHPTDLSFDRQGNLYVSDYGNHRIQRFSIEKN